MLARVKRPRLVISLPLSTGPGSTLHFHHCRLCYRAVLLRFFRAINCTVIEREAAKAGEREDVLYTPKVLVAFGKNHINRYSVCMR